MMYLSQASLLFLNVCIFICGEAIQGSCVHHSTDSLVENNVEDKANLKDENQSNDTVYREDCKESRDAKTKVTREEKYFICSTYCTQCLWTEKKCDAFRGFREDDNQNAMPFSTSDVDNDGCHPACQVNSQSVKSCSYLHNNTGWWFNQCGLTNLNGVHRVPGKLHATGIQGVHGPKTT